MLACRGLRCYFEAETRPMAYERQSLNVLQLTENKQHSEKLRTDCLHPASLFGAKLELTLKRGRSKSLTGCYHAARGGYEIHREEVQTGWS